MATVAQGQAIYSPVGGEYAVAGALPGDQMMPAVSVSRGGGYVVWQDQTLLGNNLSIRGRALDSGFSPVFPPFRINSSSKGDAENPQVALLHNGGAVFTWQAGVLGFQHIYARFLAPTNGWLALDQMVNGSPRIYQANPAVAVLTNGNVVIVYAGFNTNTMQDVYGQMFSPTGQKVGAEFQINQFTAFNQRSPAVTAVPSGGFVVAWVSEQQRAVTQPDSTSVNYGQISRPSVDIYARLFDGGGAALSSEFPVNTSTHVCANPTAAAAADGSLMFAWSEKDGDVQANGWDVFARPFTMVSPGLLSGGVEQYVNTQLLGDQYDPKLTATGTNFLAVWTSMGQDGSREGVFGQLLNEDGSHAGGEFQVNTKKVGAQQQQALGTDNAGRCLAVWSGPTFSPTRNDLFAQIYAGAGFVLPPYATNYGSPKFVGDTVVSSIGPVGSNTLVYPYVEPPTLDYPGTIVPAGSGFPATNAFALAAGAYNGLFYPSDVMTPASSGYFSAATTAGKSYTAKITLAGMTYSIAGAFDDFGASGTRIIYRGGLAPLTLALQLDLFGNNQISGWIKSGGDWTAELVADRQVFNKTTNKSPLAGQYTLVIPGSTTGAASPAGAGFGTVTVDAAGGVTWSGSLADGTKVNQISAASASGIWPLYAPINGGGCVISWVQLTATPAGTNGAVSGDLVWFKPSARGTAYYPAGFTNEVSISGSAYQAPVSGIHSLSLSGAGLAQPLTWTIQFNAGSKVTNLSTNKLNFLLTPMTGAFTASAPVPGSAKTITFQGVLLDGGTGAGYFLGPNQSGPVNLH